jgi:hypothetical protein
MKRIPVIAAAFLAVAGLRAQTEAPRSSYSVTADFTYTTKYVFRGVQLARDSFQPSVEVAVGDAYVDLWTNQPIVRHEDNEIDLRAGFRRKVSGVLSIEVFGTGYWYPEAAAGGTRKSAEAGVGATYDARGVSTNLFCSYDVILKATTLEGSAGYSLALPSFGTSLDASVYAGTSSARDARPDSGLTVRESYDYCGADLRMPYSFSESSRLTIGLHWATSWNRVPGALKNRVWFDISFSAGF